MNVFKSSTAAVWAANCIFFFKYLSRYVHIWWTSMFLLAPSDICEGITNIFLLGTKLTLLLFEWVPYTCFFASQYTFLTYSIESHSRIFWIIRSIKRPTTYMSMSIWGTALPLFCEMFLWLTTDTSYLIIWSNVKISSERNASDFVLN